MSIKYVGYKVTIPVDLWDQIYAIAEDEWTSPAMEKERDLEIKIATPGVIVSPPMNNILVRLIEKGLEKETSI